MAVTNLSEAGKRARQIYLNEYRDQNRAYYNDYQKNLYHKKKGKSDPVTKLEDEEGVS